MVWTLNHGQNTINASQAGYAVPTMYGRTRINILGKDGNCESVGKNTLGSVSEVLDSTNKAIGSASLKYTATGGSAEHLVEFGSSFYGLNINSYYVVLAYTKPNVGHSRIRAVTFTSSGGVVQDCLANMITDNTKFSLSYLKFATGTTEVKVLARAQLYNVSDISVFTPAGTPENANFDGYRIYQIPVAEYNALGVTLTDLTAIDLQYPYIDSVKHVTYPFISNGTDYIYGISDSSGNPLQLASSPDNTIRDTLTLKDGFYRKTKNFMTNVILDGALTWACQFDFVGYKVYKFPITNNITSAYSFSTTKFDGKVLSYDNTFATTDVISMNSPSDSYFVAVSDSDFGIGETYVPSILECQAYFYGFRMNNGTFGTPYNGSGTKTWTTLEATSNTGSVTTVPTTQAILTTYTNYKLTYQLATPIEEIVNVEGSLPLIVGNNTIEIGEGVIVREFITPFLNSGSYYINAINSSSYLTKRVSKIIAVYKNGTIDTQWSFTTSGTLNGTGTASIASANFDSSANYSTTYIVQDKYSLTTNLLDASIDLIRTGTKIDISTLNPTALVSYNRYLTLCTQPSKTSSEITEMNNLSSLLDDYIITASDFNSKVSSTAVTITDNKTGLLSGLNTTDHSSLVNATNELNQKVTANAQINSLKHEISQLKMISSVKNRVDGATGIMFDDMSGLNAASVGIIDLTKTNTTSSLSVGTITIPVLSTTGLAIGKEVTIFDDVNLERKIITGISGLNLTVSALSFAYKIQAQVCRSSVVQDTVNKLLKFGGWNYQTGYSNIGVTVVASPYGLPNTASPTIILTLSNGTMITTVRNTSTTTSYFYKSTDGGATWTQICTLTGSSITIGLTNIGNIVFAAVPNGTTSYKCYKIDITTQTNVDISGSPVGTIFSTTSGGFSEPSITTDGTNLFAAWVCQDLASSFPNSYNVGFAKSTNNGVTWTKMSGSAGVDLLTTENVSGTNNDAPRVSILSNGNPTLGWSYANGSVGNTYRMNFIRWTGSAWSSVVQSFSDATRVQRRAGHIVKRYGSNIGRIWSQWEGTDATDTAVYNLRANWSDTDGASWNTAFKITSGNSSSMQSGVLSENTNGDIYLFYQDGALINYRICLDGATTFGSATTLTTGTSPSVIERLGAIFTVPPIIYLNSSVVKFAGSFIAGAIFPVLVEDIRYNINPPSNISSAVSWIQHESDPNYSIAGALSIQSSGGNESYSSMTKSTVSVDGSHVEDQFSSSISTNAKGTLRYTLTRNSTSLVKNISQITGAVG